jgi:hypothetical protein
MSKAKAAPVTSANPERGIVANARCSKRYEPGPAWSWLWVFSKFMRNENSTADDLGKK